MSWTRKPLRFRSRESHCGLVEAVTRWRFGPRFRVAKSDPWTAIGRRSIRPRSRDALREISRQDPESSSLRGAFARSQDRLPRNSWTPQAEPGSLNLGQLSRISARLHVGD